MVSLTSTQALAPFPLLEALREGLETCFLPSRRTGRAGTSRTSHSKGCSPSRRSQARPVPRGDGGDVFSSTSCGSSPRKLLCPSPGIALIPCVGFLLSCTPLIHTPESPADTCGVSTPAAGEELRDRVG